MKKLTKLSRIVLLGLLLCSVSIVFSPSLNPVEASYSYDYLVMDGTIDSSWSATWTNWFEIRLYSSTTDRIYSKSSSNKISSGATIDFYPNVVLVSRTSDVISDGYRAAVCSKWQTSNRTNVLKYSYNSVEIYSQNNPFGSSYSNYSSIIYNATAWRPDNRTFDMPKTSISGENFQSGTHSIFLQMYLVAVRDNFGTQVHADGDKLYQKAFTFNVSLTKSSAVVSKTTLVDGVFYIPAVSASDTVIVSRAGQANDGSYFVVGSSELADTADVVVDNIALNSLVTVQISDWTGNYRKAVGNFYRDTRTPRLSNSNDVYEWFKHNEGVTTTTRTQLGTESTSIIRSFELGVTSENVRFAFSAAASAPESATIQFWAGSGDSSTTSSYTSNTYLSAVGAYTLTISDVCGNQTTINFAIDKTKPTANSLPEYTNKDIIFEPTDDNIVSKIYYRKGTSGGYTLHSGSKYTVSATTSNNSVWYFYAEDIAGNITSTVNSTLDTIAPQVTSTLLEFTNSDIRFAVSDTNHSKIFYQFAAEGYSSTSLTSYTITALGSNNGKWSFYAEDKAGNKTTVHSSTLDTIAPTFSALSEFTNQAITFTASDLNGVATTYYRKGSSGNYSSVSSSTYTVAANAGNNGKWSFYAVDKAGNVSSTASSTLDTVAPTFSTLPEFTNQAITFSASDLNGVATTYYRKGSSGNYSSVSSSTYTVAANAGNNSIWYFYAVDKAGNVSSTASSTLDTVAPTFSTLPEFTNQAITFTASDLNGVATVHQKLGTETETSKAGSSTTIAATLENNGVWKLYAIDKAGNKSSTATVTLDTIAPSNTNVPTITNNAFEYSATDTNLYRIYYRMNDGSYSYAASKTTISATFSNNGVWYFYAEDKAGNISPTISCIMDTIAPTHSHIPEYTNANIMFSASDLNGVARIYYRKGTSGAYTVLSGSAYEVVSSAAANDIWHFYAEDIAGNKSSPTTSVLCVVETFENKARQEQNYKVTSWYRVTLPSRIFSLPGNDISGIYTFSNYESALSYAIAKETEYRCSEIENGWIYVSISNEAVAQIYTDKTALDTAILKYAKSYISTEQRFANGSNNYYTTMDDKGNVDSTALVRQTLQLPSFLDFYSNLTLMMVSTSFSYTQLAHSFAKVPAAVEITMIANDVQLVNSDAISVPFGVTLKNALGTNLKQGFYLVKESDAAGNMEQYIIYIDLTPPSLIASATTGVGSTDIVYNVAYINTYAGTLYYTSFSLCSLSDVDNYSMVRVNGKGIDSIFLTGELFPTLELANGYSGRYTITLYDRSLNTLSFEVVIAGNAPGWTYTSLKSDTKLTINITLNGDSLNVLTSIRLFKILSDGTYQELHEDGDGTPITTLNTRYVVYTGGKYTVILTDLYSRTVEMEAVFFELGLPTGTFTGVNIGGRTNKDITFTYSADNILVVYHYVDGVKVVFNEYSSNYSQTTYMTTITIYASEATSYEYLFFLHTNYDIGLFIEYTFEIDCILSPVSILADGVEVEQDGSTNKAFLVTWSDTKLAIKYYSSANPLGSINAVPYKKDTLIKDDALYYFIVTDDVGNTVDFTVYLKTKISYKISGDYIMVNGAIVSNNHISITVLDTTTSFDVSNEDGHIFTNGSPIINDGIYTLTVKDGYSNVLILVIEIDTVAPVITLEGAAIGGKTKESVTVTFEDGSWAYLTNSKGVVTRVIKQGEVFDEHGLFYVKAVDKANNSTLISFEIIRYIDFAASCLNAQITSSPVTISFTSKVKQSITHNGEPIESAASYTAAGEYSIIAIDEVGNRVEFAFTILHARATGYAFTLPTGFEVYEVYLNEEVTDDFRQNDNILVLENNGAYKIILLETVSGSSYELLLEVDRAVPEAVIEQTSSSFAITDFSKQNVSFTLLMDGKEIDYKVGKPLTAPGKYMLIVVDDLGNENVYEFVIPYKLNTWSIVAISIGAAIFLVLLIVFVRSRTKIKV